MWPAAPALEVLHAWAFANEITEDFEGISSDTDTNASSVVASTTIGNNSDADAAAAMVSTSYLTSFAYFMLKSVFLVLTGSSWHGCLSSSFWCTVSLPS